MSEAGFSMKAKGKNAASYADCRFRGFQGRSVGISILFKKLRRGGGPIELVRVGFVPASLDFGELFLALKKLIDRVKR